MAMKAYINNDYVTYNAIMESDQPREQKALGRKVHPFNASLWDKMSYHIVFTGCIFKFKQNPKMLEKLLSTGDKILVEASPYDRIWGIGYSEEDALDNIESWGYNKLGKVLMNVRDCLNG
jgi:ribA/ribD-fused uncharacterized protein